MLFKTLRISLNNDHRSSGFNKDITDLAAFDRPKSALSESFHICSLITFFVKKTWWENIMILLVSEKERLSVL
jgi:hypothetical protein